MKVHPRAYPYPPAAVSTLISSLVHPPPPPPVRAEPAPCVLSIRPFCHQTSLIAFFAQTLAEAPRRGLPDFWRGPSQPLALAPLRDGVAASADGLIVQQSQR